MASSAADPAIFPPGRYGRRRAPHPRQRRWLAVALAGVVCLAGLAIALKLYRQYAQAPYQVQLIDVSGISDSEVTVTFEVRKPEGQPASCTVLAHTREGREVGRATVEVPASAPARSRVTYTLATTARPITGQVPGCGPGR